MDQQDLYFFGHGWDYKQALYDYVQVGGSPAMTPRYAHGTWWTRWFDFDNSAIEDIVEQYRERALPLDVFVLDMDW